MGPYDLPPSIKPVVPEILLSLFAFKLDGAILMHFKLFFFFKTFSVNNFVVSLLFVSRMNQSLLYYYRSNVF